MADPAAAKLEFYYQLEAKHLTDPLVGWCSFGWRSHSARGASLLRVLLVMLLASRSVLCGFLRVGVLNGKHATKCQCNGQESRPHFVSPFAGYYNITDAQGNMPSLLTFFQN